MPRDFCVVGATYRSPSKLKTSKTAEGSNSQGEVVTVREDPPKGVGTVVVSNRTISHTVSAPAGERCQQDGSNSQLRQILVVLREAVQRNSPPKRSLSTIPNERLFPSDAVLEKAVGKSCFGFPS